MNLSSYLKYSGGILLIILLLYWIQSNLLPTPDIPSGLRIGDYGLIGGVAFWIERTIKFIIKSKPKNNTIGKIGLYIFLIFFLFFIGLLIQQVFANEQMRPTWLTMVFSLMGPYFFTYSKWANDNIWNTKLKDKTIANPHKDLEKENGNSDYIKIDKKLFNSILIVLGIIVIFYIGYNLGGANNSEVNEDSRVEDEYISKVKEPEYSGEYEYLYAYPNGNNLWDTSLSPKTSPQIITIAKRRVGENIIRTEYRVNQYTYSLREIEDFANSKESTLHNLFRKNPSIEIIFTE